jgi:Dolichyl-phosphate-mannose-protein mannosyltransferase
LDVQARSRRLSAWHLALGAVLLLALLLRLKSIHDPLLDHPGWRQGDTAAIARNFATLDPNPFHPQTDYDGPPPNYVELELQIVPILAGALYRIFGVHEIFGRLISIAFSLAGVALLAYFARELCAVPQARREDQAGGSDPPRPLDPPHPFVDPSHASDPPLSFDAAGIAGIAAALTFALYPGAVYYGRTFTPDTAMVTLAIAGVFASYRWIVNDGARFGRSFALAALLTALAILAKPVAILILVPIAALLFAQLGPRALRSPAAWTFLVLAVAPYALYDAYLRGIAEWHWASGITTKHVLPELRAAFGSGGAFVHKLGAFRDALGMLWATMLGPAGALVALAALFVPLRSAPRALLFGWLGAALAYAYVVVTVERVDYYLYLFLPPAALWTGMLAALVAVRATTRPGGRAFAAGAAAVVVVAALWSGHLAVRPYYDYSKDVYRRARALDASLPPGALIVMGHYDPSVLYYIGRKGWEEDPLLWTPFDEESAIRKGARAFVSIEDNRLRRNVELCHWLERFPLAAPGALWPVYQTDPVKILPGAEEHWQNFRKLEAAGRAPPCVRPA